MVKAPEKLVRTPETNYDFEISKFLSTGDVKSLTDNVGIAATLSALGKMHIAAVKPGFVISELQTSSQGGEKARELSGLLNSFLKAAVANDDWEGKLLDILRGIGFTNEEIIHEASRQFSPALIPKIQRGMKERGMIANNVNLQSKPTTPPFPKREPKVLN